MTHYLVHPTRTRMAVIPEMRHMRHPKKKVPNHPTEGRRTHDRTQPPATPRHGPRQRPRPPARNARPPTRSSPPRRAPEPTAARFGCSGSIARAQTARRAPPSGRWHPDGTAIADILHDAHCPAARAQCRGGASRDGRRHRRTSGRADPPGRRVHVALSAGSRQSTAAAAPARAATTVSWPTVSTAVCAVTS